MNNEQLKRITRGKSSAEIKRDMAVIGKNRAQNPIMEGVADVLPWFLYDRQTTAANTLTATQYDYFTTPIGGTKTKQDTNMEQVSRLPDPQWMNVTSLQFYTSSRMLVEDIGTLLDTYYCEFIVSGKVYAEGPIMQFPGGAGVSGFTTQTNTGAFSNGINSPLAVNDFRMGNDDTGITILQGQTFKVSLKSSAGFTTKATTYNANAIGLNLLCVLEGVLSRQVS